MADDTTPVKTRTGEEKSEAIALFLVRILNSIRAPCCVFAKEREGVETMYGVLFLREYGGSGSELDQLPVIPNSSLKAVQQLSE